MEERKLKMTLLTPMFSYGAYRGMPEIRTSEIKGMMRYVYRITCSTDCKKLAMDEAELFGGAAGNEVLDAGHASPIRLVANNTLETGSVRLLSHYKEKNPCMKCFKSGQFDLSVRLNHLVARNMKNEFLNVDLDWYIDLIRLTFTLCGLGKRSRKGKGNIVVEDQRFATDDAALNWICKMLNKVSKTSSAQPPQSYKCTDKIISAQSTSAVKRPVIQKIQLGQTPIQNDAQMNGFLGMVDKACHDAKSDKGYNLYEKAATGFAKSNERLSSPLFISFVQIGKVVYPLYVFVKAVFREREIDTDLANRDAFVKDIEREMKRGERGTAQ